MQSPVKERILKLREEIAQISEADRLYLNGAKKKMPGTAGDHERRLQRDRGEPEERRSDGCPDAGAIGEG